MTSQRSPASVKPAPNQITFGFANGDSTPSTATIAGRSTAIEVREFPTFTAVLRATLAGGGGDCRGAGGEGLCWRPVWSALEDRWEAVGASSCPDGIGDWVVYSWSVWMIGAHA